MRRLPHLALIPLSGLVTTDKALAETPAPTPDQLVDALNGVFGQHHARAVHAKGVILEGTFAHPIPRQVSARRHICRRLRCWLSCVFRTSPASRRFRTTILMPTIDKSLLFLPNALPDGIQPADPMIDARSAAYVVSFGRRQ
jgi:hypothetical protein